MTSYTPTYDPYTPYVRPEPSDALPMTQEERADPDREPSIMYTFEVPEGADVEWPIQTLENDIVRLEPLDVSLFFQWRWIILIAIYSLPCRCI